MMTPNTTTTTPAAPKTKITLLGMSLPEIVALVTDHAHQPAFRARQLHHWLYKQGARTFDEMTNLAKPFRAWLHENCTPGFPEVAQQRVSKVDGTIKLLLRLNDGELIESVLMRERDWWTVCVSSQAGCALGCTFCTTGMGGFRRNLTRGEIVAQVLEARRLVPPDELLRNIVFMGMGEPLLNYDEVIAALRVITDPEAIAIASRRITLSTAGVVPQLEQIFAEDLGIKIAISLSGINDEERNAIMPVGKKWGIADILRVCRAADVDKRLPITFEYVLLAGVNDSDAHARALSRLLRGVCCKVNLIPFNPGKDSAFKRPSATRAAEFFAILSAANYTVATRMSRGLDVDGACGQLAGRARREGGD